MRQHSHSSTAQPGKSYCANFEKIDLEIDLAVAERAEAAGAVGPGLETAIHALAARRIELRILDVKHSDTLVVDVDVFEIVELLQHEVAGVVEDVAALVTADAFEEHLEGRTIMQVFAGVDLVADIDALGIEGIEDRAPALRQFVEGRLDQIPAAAAATG